METPLLDKIISIPQRDGKSLIWQEIGKFCMNIEGDSALLIDSNDKDGSFITLPIKKIEFSQR